MSRARDNADLGDSYGSLAVGVTGGSGLNAVSPANLASGVLPVGVTGGSGLTALGTVTAGDLSNTAIVYPAGHVIYRDYLSFTSTGAGSDPSTTWTDTSLTLTVPAATADTLSSIWIGISNSCTIVPSTHTYAQFRIRRVDPGTDVTLAYNDIGHDGAWWASINTNIQGQDESLVTGEDHVYKYQYRSSDAAYSGIIYYHGYNWAESVRIATMSLFGFK